MRIALALERYHTAAHGDVDRTPMMRWSDSSPLVNDLMAAGIRLCSYMIGVDPERSQTLIVPLRSMHHACSDWRSQTFCADSLTDLNPSFARGATLQNVTLHRPQYVALARCSEHSAEPTDQAASAHHRDGAESSGSTLGTLEQCQRSHYRCNRANCGLIRTRPSHVARVKLFRTLYGCIQGPATRVT